MEQFHTDGRRAARRLTGWADREQAGRRSLVWLPGCWAVGWRAVGQDRSWLGATVPLAVASRSRRCGRLFLAGIVAASPLAEKPFPGVGAGYDADGEEHRDDADRKLGCEHG